jgi:DNA-binding NarL/FixJ family response regulator
MARIMIVEDHPIFLHGLTDFLSRNGHEICCVARSRADALEKLSASHADVAILDVHLPDGSGIDLVSEIRGQKLAIATILLSGAMTSQECKQAMAQGVNGMLLKDSDPDIVLRCIDSVLMGHRWIEGAIMDSAMSAGSAPAQSNVGAGVLTRAERAIADQVISGLRNREVANILGLSEGTVKVHVHNIFRKLGVNSRTALAHQLRQG